MPRFITVGYGGEAGYRRTPEALKAAAHEQDARLQKAGAVIGMAGKPVQVRNPEASGVTVTEGPYMVSPLPIAGFAIIEAANLDEAIKQVSGVPCAICHGVVEVWPLE